MRVTRNSLVDAVDVVGIEAQSPMYLGYCRAALPPRGRGRKWHVCGNNASAEAFSDLTDEPRVMLCGLHFSPAMNGNLKVVR